MDFTGKVIQVHITFTMNEQCKLASIEEIKDAEKLAITVKKWRKKRSLNANNYAWQLMTELAHVHGTSKEEVYELMLQSYGTYMLDDNGNVAMISVLEHIDCSKLDWHLEYAGKGHVGDKVFNHYRILKGSSEYDTKEMSVFIEGIVSECKDAGIDTITPDELAKMTAAWEGARNEKRITE